jgi:hypothetical protein
MLLEELRSLETVSMNGSHRDGDEKWIRLG